VGLIQYIAVGWIGAGLVLLALVAAIAWQALPELNIAVEDQSVAIKLLARLARVWLPLVAAASVLTLLRVALLT